MVAVIGKIEYFFPRDPPPTVNTSPTAAAASEPTDTSSALPVRESVPWEKIAADAGWKPPATPVQWPAGTGMRFDPTLTAWEGLAKFNGWTPP